MAPRLPFAALRALPSASAAWVRVRVRVQVQVQVPLHHARFASSSADGPQVYDVVCVGGGPAGLSLLAGLKASPTTSGLKVALVEGQDLHKSRLHRDASVESFSNRCSSLTPASVRNLQGTPQLASCCQTTKSNAMHRNWSMGACKRAAGAALPGDAGMGRRERRAHIL